MALEPAAAASTVGHVAAKEACGVLHGNDPQLVLAYVLWLYCNVCGGAEPLHATCCMRRVMCAVWHLMSPLQCHML
jgi:hypothetical protein